MAVHAAEAKVEGSKLRGQVLHIALACRGWRGVPRRPPRGGAEFGSSADGRRARNLDALRERDRAEGLARAYRDQGDTMRWIADEAGLPYCSVNRIIKAWKARANARYKT